MTPEEIIRELRSLENAPRFTPCEGPGLRYIGEFIGQARTFLGEPVDVYTSTHAGDNVATVRQDGYTAVTHYGSRNWEAYKDQGII